MTDKVFSRAKEIVCKPAPRFGYGYGDVGDVLVSYLQGECNEAGALERLSLLDQDYSRARGD